MKTNNRICYNRLTEAYREIPKQALKYKDEEQAINPKCLVHDDNNDDDSSDVRSMMPHVNSNTPPLLPMMIGPAESLFNDTLSSV